MVYSQMLFALFWERVVWGTVPKWLSIVGSVMILGSVIFVGVRKSKKTVPKKELVVRDEEVGFLQEAEEREREQEQEYERERQQEQEQQREVENGVAGAPIRL